MPAPAHSGLAIWNPCSSCRRLSPLSRQEPEAAQNDPLELSFTNVPAWFRKLKASDTKRRQVIKLLDGIVDRGAPEVATDVGQLLAQIFKWV
jgi:hypothetical protein